MIRSIRVIENISATYEEQQGVTSEACGSPPCGQVRTGGFSTGARLLSNFLSV
jgi:hypothetical protein